MFDLQKLSTKLAIDALSNSTITIGGKKYKIHLEEDTEKRTILLSEILSFQEDSSHERKEIEAYGNYYAGSKRFRKLLFLISCLYIFVSTKTKQERNEAMEKMSGFFNVEDRKAFVSTVNEFENLHHSKNSSNVTKQVIKIYNDYYGYDKKTIFKILEFGLYNHFDFDIELDVLHDFSDFFVEVDDAQF